MLLIFILFVLWTANITLGTPSIFDKWIETHFIYLWTNVSKIVGLQAFVFVVLFIATNIKKKFRESQSHGAATRFYTHFSTKNILFSLFWMSLCLFVFVRFHIFNHVLNSYNYNTTQTTHYTYLSCIADNDYGGQLFLITVLMAIESSFLSVCIIFLSCIQLNLILFWF